MPRELEGALPRAEAEKATPRNPKDHTGPGYDCPILAMSSLAGPWWV